MSRYNHHHEITPKGYAYRTLVVVAATALLALFMPRGSRTHMEYNIGKPWYDSPVIAKETFPLLKPDSLLKAERQAVMAGYKPIFERNVETGETQIRRFVKAYNTTLRNEIPFYYRQRIADRLREIYETGILPTEAYERSKQEGHTMLTVSVKNEGQEMEFAEVFTPKTAYDRLVHDPDSTRFHRSLLQRCDLDKYITPNLTYDKFRSESEQERLEKSVSLYRGEVLAGQEIVRRGQIVDEKTFLTLRSMETFYQQGEKQSTAEKWSQAVGQTLYVGLVLVCLLIFFNQFRRDYLQQAHTVALVLFLTLSFPLITYLLAQYGLSAYLVPYCMLPIFIRVFMDSRTAFITHISSVLLSAVAIASPFEFILIQLITGLVAIYSLKQLSERAELFRAVVLVVLAAMACQLCFDLIRQSFFKGDGFDHMPYLFFVVNGILLLLSYLLLFPFERIFKFTSMVTLVELSNTNHEILRRLAEEAPGTFQHSMQVANLAAEVANKLGAKSQLVRTGALYHDIGKVVDPIFFTENQNGTNPHDNLSYIHSAQIIISHVEKGLELAEKYKLPTVIREFISTHHGKSTTRYFYVSYKNAHPDEEVDESLFTYPGPNPSTLEQAILMMADAVEASSRSLPEYTEESVSQLVERIIGTQMQEGYFDQCPITFEDISIAKQVFKEKLMTIYHTRVKYPELKKGSQTGSTS